MQVMMSESGAGGMSECLDAQHTAGGLYTLTFLPRLFGHTLKQWNDDGYLTEEEDQRWRIMDQDRCVTGSAATFHSAEKKDFLMP